jgi:hypothetical protein
MGEYVPLAPYGYASGDIPIRCVIAISVGSKLNPK